MIKEAYIAIDPKTRQVVGACRAGVQDSPGVAEFIKQGLIIDRVTVAKAKDLFLSQLPDEWEL